MLHAERALLPGDVVALSSEGPAFVVAVEPKSLHPATAAANDRMPPAATGQRGPSITGLRQTWRDALRPLARRAGQTGPGLRRGRMSLWACLIAMSFGAGVVLDRVQHARPDHGGVGAAQFAASRTTSIASVSRAPAPAAILPANAASRVAPAPLDAVVSLVARWRLYDGFTGKPVFQKTVTRAGQKLNCFVQLR